MLNPVDTQHLMATALLDPSAPIPSAIRGARRRVAESRFAIYRNNVIVSLINALRARFPVVRRLLCEESFRALARRYVTAEPPRSPILLLYGDTFPQFIRRCGAGASADYVADIAELEFARCRAFHAMGAEPLDCASLAALPHAKLKDLCLTLHPSTFLVASRFPIVSLWEANQRGGDNMLYRWTPECALVARPRSEVEIWRLPPGGDAFVGALVGGCTIGDAIAAGVAEAQSFDLVANFVTLMGANIVTGIRRPER